MNENSQVKLAIIIPVYNRFNHILDLLQSLDFQKFRDFQVTVVDHGTEDLWANHNDYKFNLNIIKASPSLWFTGATNTGIRYVLNHEKQLSFIMIMNDDIQIKDENFLQIFINESKENAIISCMAINSDNKKVIYAGIKLRKIKCLYQLQYQDCKPEEIYENKIFCDVLPTRATLIPISVIKQIGLLNEKKLPQYRSDYEWTNRAKKNNIDLIMLTSTYLKTQRSSNKVTGLNQYSKNKLHFFMKDLFNKHKSGNIYDMVNYPFLVFSWPYAFFFTTVCFFRKLLAFVVVNYLTILYNTLNKYKKNKNF